MVHGYTFNGKKGSHHPFCLLHYVFRVYCSMFSLCLVFSYCATNIRFAIPFIRWLYDINFHFFLHMENVMKIGFCYATIAKKLSVFLRNVHVLRNAFVSSFTKWIRRDGTERTNKNTYTSNKDNIVVDFFFVNFGLFVPSNDEIFLECETMLSDEHWTYTHFYRISYAYGLGFSKIHSGSGR